MGTEIPMPEILLNIRDFSSVKLALVSLTSGGRSVGIVRLRTIVQATEFSFCSFKVGYSTYYVLSAIIYVKVFYTKLQSV
jgi:hypothetical protein